MTTDMTAFSKHPPIWQCHKHAESTDSELSYFDPSSSSSSSMDSWSGYFEGWEGQPRDSYCPQIASSRNSPAQPSEPEDGHSSEPELLPTACPRRRDPASLSNNDKNNHTSKPPSKTRRYGMVACIDPDAGAEALQQLNKTLQNPMSSTEDILSALDNPAWDVAALERWWQQSQRSNAELALFKIMFSLRYTADEPSPLP